jgi:signal transduction histidine kinase
MIAVPHTVSLAETPSTPAARRTAIGVVGVLACLGVTSSLLPGTPVATVNGPSFQATYNLLTCLCDGITAFLLIVQFRQTAFLPFLCLGGGYMFSGLMAALHVLAIPGVLIVPDVFGVTANTSMLVRACWLAGQPLGGLAFAVAMRRPHAPLDRVNRLSAMACGAVVLLAALVVLVVTRFDAWMPDLTDKAENWGTTYVFFLPALLALQLAAIFTIIRSTRCRTVLSLWLTVALVSGLTETVIGWWLPGVGVAVGRRYSLLFYVARIAGAISTSLLLLVMLHQIAALYARLVATVRSLQQSERHIVEQQRMGAIAQLAGGVAHDFNNLLTVISGNLDLVRAGVLEERHQRRLDAASMAAHRGARLTRQMLTFARRQMLRPEVHDLHTLLQEAEDLIQSASGGEIILTRNFRAPAAVCRIDRAEFDLAVLNIVVNAKQAMGQGGTLTISTDLLWVSQSRRLDELDAPLPDGAYVRLSFADTGPGMQPEVMSRAFEPFFTTKGIGAGSGLGLSQVHGFAGQAGGTATLSSVPGKGVTVLLYLPLETARTVPVPKPNPRPAPSLKATVVLVEDTEDVRDTVAAMLANCGCTVFPAASGQEALALIEQHCSRLDILVTDIVMPGGMSGVALVDHARRCCPDLAVLLMTGYAGQPEPGYDTMVLRKPFSESDLAERVQATLADRRGAGREQVRPDHRIETS